MTRIGCWSALLALLLGTLTCGPALAQSPSGLDSAVAYVEGQQQPDGSFAGFGPGSTADAVFALAAAGRNPAEVKNGGKSAVDYMVAQAPQQAGDVGVSAKFLIAMQLSGQPSSGQGYDLPAAVEAGYDAATGRYGADVSSHCYALIGLRAAGVDVPPAAVDALRQLQLPDGGWSFDGTEATGSDTNTTSLAIQALAAVGERGDPVGKAVAYLKAQQNDDAGWPYVKGGPGGGASDSNSTALAIQGLLAAGENPESYARNGTSPADRLLAFQNPSGAFRYQDGQSDDNAFSTYQAVPALDGSTLPLEPVAAGAPAALPAAGAGDALPMLALAALVLLVTGTYFRRKGATAIR